MSTCWEEGRERFEEQVRIGLVVPEAAVSVGVSLDGVLVPMKDGGRAQKRAQNQARGKPASGPAGYREVGCATISLYDAQGERLATVRQGRMPQKNKKDLKDWMVAELGFVLRQRPDLVVVKLADGARDNWTFLGGSRLPCGKCGYEVVDFYHAAEHLSRALAAAYGEGTVRFQRRFKTLRGKLLRDEDGVEKVIRALRYLRSKHPKKDGIAKELGYFRRNRHRMTYALVKGLHLPIGSGVIEAACKTLATARMKQSGMRWGPAGGQAVLTFRALVQSDRFDVAWTTLASTYRAEVSLPENVVQLNRRAA